MKEKMTIEEKFEQAFEKAAGLNPVFPAAARQQMAQMAEAIAKANENIAGRLATNQKIDVKGGFLAEEFHSETYNLDAILKGDSSRAITDRYKTEWHEQGLRGNDNPDIVIIENGEIVVKAQSKYMKTSQKTAGQFSQITKDGDVKYGDNDIYLAPSEQVNDVKNHAARISKEKQAAGADALAESFKQTSEKTQGTIKKGKVSSTELTKKEANDLAKGDLDKLHEIEGQFQTKSTLKQMGNAAVGAAAMSAVISGSINTLNYISLAKAGKITPQDAALKIVGETVASAADSAVKAASTTGVQSLIVRYGSKELAREVLAQQGLKAMMKGNAVSVAVVCAVDAVKDLVRLGMGDISKDEFYERQGKGILMTSAGIVGSTFGAAGAAGMAAALGATTGSAGLAVASLIGGLSGGMIAGLAMTLAIENGIEKPYRDLVENTGNLQEAARELESVSHTVLKSQILFSSFLEIDQLMEDALQDQFATIDNANKRAFSAVDKLNPSAKR